MKCAPFVFAVLLLSVSVSIAMPEMGKTELGGDFWFRYHLDRTDETTQRSAFTVERGYIGMAHTWSPQVDGQMTVNVFSSPTSTGNGWTFELRDAYVNLGYLVPNGKIRAGLQKNYFGTVYDWKYSTVRHGFADAVGVVQERDYGVALLGAIPQEMGEWSLGVMNGEGFSSGLSPAFGDKQPAIMANVRIMPMMETVIGLSVLRDKRYVYPWTATEYSPESRLGYMDRTAVSFVAKWGRGPLSLMGEYLYYDYPIPDRDDLAKAVNVKGAGFSIFPKMRLTEKMEMVGRYDMWDPDKDSDRAIWELSPGGMLASPPAGIPSPWWVPSEYSPQYYFVKHNVYVAGFNYNITDRMTGEPGVLLQVNWQRMDPQEDIKNMDPLKPVDTFVFQVTWGWGGLDF